MKTKQSAIKKIASSIHGIGIASRFAISKGAIVYQIPFIKKSNVFQEHWAYIHGVWYSDDGALDWLNHSCDPNVGIVVLDGRPSLRALRDIAVGEELTCDYDVTEGGGRKKVLCDCGAEECRGAFYIQR